MFCFSISLTSLWYQLTLACISAIGVWRIPTKQKYKLHYRCFTESFNIGLETKDELKGERDESDY